MRTQADIRRARQRRGLLRAAKGAGRKLDDLTNQLAKMEKRLMANWADVKREVQETKDASQALMRVLQSVRVQLADLLTRETIDPAELQAVHDDLDKNSAEMVAAALEGTRAEPTEEEKHARSM